MPSNLQAFANQAGTNAQIVVYLACFSRSLLLITTYETLEDSSTADQRFEFCEQCVAVTSMNCENGDW